MRRFQEAGRSTSSTQKGQQASPPPKHPRKGLQTHPYKAQKIPSANYRRQRIQREAGDIKKAAQQAAER